MSKVIRFGGDAGNSALKLSVEGLDERIYIPSLYTEAVEYGMDATTEDETVSDILDYLDVTVTTPAIATRKRLIIGNKVVRDGLPATYLPIGVKKSREEFPLVLLLVGLAAAAVKLNPSLKNVKVEFEGGIALPVSQLQPAETKIAEERLVGSHTVAFNLPSGEVVVSLHIPFVKCAPEGAIASYDMIYDYEGNVKNEKYLESLIQHFDIGDGTTEMPVTRGLKYEKNLSRGIKVGVATALDNIINSFNLNNDYELRSRRHVIEIYTDKDHKRHEALKKVADPHLKQLANLLSTQFTNQLRNAQDVSVVVVHGGGALIIKDHLKAIMEDRNYELEFLKDPVNTTANGLLKFALSPRFLVFRDKKLAEVEVATSQDKE